MKKTPIMKLFLVAMLAWIPVQAYSSIQTVFCHPILMHEGQYVMFMGGKTITRVVPTSASVQAVFPKSANEGTSGYCFYGSTQQIDTEEGLVQILFTHSYFKTK